MLVVVLPTGMRYRCWLYDGCRAGVEVRRWQRLKADRLENAPSSIQSEMAWEGGIPCRCPAATAGQLSGAKPDWVQSCKYASLWLAHNPVETTNPSFVFEGAYQIIRAGFWSTALLHRRILLRICKRSKTSPDMPHVRLCMIGAGI